MHYIHYVIRFVFILLFSLFFEACSSNTQEDTDPKQKVQLSIAFASWPGFDIIYFAQEHKLFQKHGVEVKLIKYPDQESVTQAMQELKVDAAMISIWDVLMLQGKHPYDILLTTNVSNGADGIVAEKRVTSIKELKGKKVATVKNSVNELILLEALQSAHMSFNDIKLIDMSNEEAVAALFHKKVSAAVVWEPLLTQTKKKIHGNIIFTTKDVNSSVIDVLIVDNESLQTKAAAWRKFLHAWYEMMEIQKRNKPMVMQIVSEKTINPNFAQDYSGLEAGDLELNREMFLNNRLKKTMHVITTLKERTQEQAPIYINTQFVKESIESYKKGDI